MDVARAFWLKNDIRKFVDLWKYREKLPYELDAISPYITGVVWDAACGEGRVVRGLRERFPDLKIYSSDLSPRFEEAVVWDLTDGKFVDCDTVLLLGVIQYLEDKVLKSLFEDLRGNRVIIRNGFVPERIYINKYVEKFGDFYESDYRTVDEVIGLLNKTHKIIAITLVYPLELESEGTFQKLIVGDKL